MSDFLSMPKGMKLHNFKLTRGNSPDEIPREKMLDELRAAAARKKNGEVKPTAVREWRQHD